MALGVLNPKSFMLYLFTSEENPEGNTFVKPKLFIFGKVDVICRRETCKNIHTHEVRLKQKEKTDATRTNANSSSSNIKMQ